MAEQPWRRALLLLMMKVRLGTILSLILLGTLALPSAAAAGAPAQSATVTITDSGFSPASVSIVPGGAVTFVNQGSAVHTATSTSALPGPFDTGGLGPGQSATVNLGQPGSYSYTSASDCLNGSSTPGFPCEGAFTIIVGAVSPGGSPGPAASPAPPSPPVTVLQKAMIAISDAGFSPANVTVTTGGAITFSNQGTTVHAATSTNAPAVFNTGGLAPGQTDTLTLTKPGRYEYTAATDCSAGDRNPAFNCTAQYAITVTTAPVGSVNTATPAFGGTLINIDDSSGFQPATLAVKAGQTVSWFNLGLNTHSVVSDSGVSPAFDSGGLGIGGAFSVTFAQPGTYTYHSSTDPTYTPGPDGQPVLSGYRFTGKVVVR